MTRTLRQRWTYDLVFGALMLAVVALGVRLGFLIHRGRTDALSRVETQQRMVTPVPARPGNIYASTRGGYVLLASSRQVPSAFVDPFILRDQQIAPLSIRIAEVLDLDAGEVYQLLKRRRDDRFVWLARLISDDKADAVRALDHPAVGISYEWRRFYPNDALAATTVGFRLHDGRGGGGVELAMDRYVRAVDGRWVVLADARRRPIWPLAERSRPPVDGGHVFLTLDAVIQGYLQDAVNDSVETHDAEWGAGIVVEPESGKILAMCSAPGYDANEFNRASAELRTNSAIVLPYEPGSVMKPLFAAAAVDLGFISYADKFFCEDGTYYAHRGGRISDHGHSYAWLTLNDIVVHSSNIGMAKLGEKLGNPTLYKIARRYGFGAPTGVALPGECSGTVRPLEKWDGYSLRRVPFGQEITASTLQLAVAFASVANGGVLLRPRIVEEVRDVEGNVAWRSSREVVRRVLRPQTARQTIGVMEEVVERGTGKACRMDRWRSFGKTGTAQVAGVGGYEDGAYAGSFVGGAPASNPRLVCIISIYKPDASKGYYGSVVAAPYVKDVLEKSLTYLDVPADKVPVGRMSRR